MTRVIALALAGLTLAPAVEAKVYSGREAQALRCAAYARAMNDVLTAYGEHDPVAVREIGQWAVRLLVYHVSGTTEQKVEAVMQIKDREAATVRDVAEATSRTSNGASTSSEGDMGDMTPAQRRKQLM